MSIGVIDLVIDSPTLKIGSSFTYPVIRFPVSDQLFLRIIVINKTKLCGRQREIFQTLVMRFAKHVRLVIQNVQHAKNIKFIILKGNILHFFASVSKYTDNSAFITSLISGFNSACDEFLLGTLQGFATREYHPNLHT